MANVPITSLPEATAPSANDYLILQGESTQKIKWSALLDKLYPVGCIYQSSSSTSPASFLGGAWERIKDRFILAAGDTYAAGSTGGEAEHALTVSEMPSHKHIQKQYLASPYSHDVNWPFENYGYIFNYDLSVNSDSADFTGKGAYPNGGDTNPTGDNNPHNNMPPYLTAYIWRRIA